MSEQYGLSCPCCGSAEHRAMSRRTFMSLVAGAAAGLAMPPAFADAQPVPSIAYDSIADPVHLPKDMYFGECSGVALNSQGHIFVLSRGNTAGPAYGALRRNFWSLPQTAASSARLDTSFMRGRSRTR